jgi:hypothetical protein
MTKRTSKPIELRLRSQAEIVAKLDWLRKQFDEVCDNPKAAERIYQRRIALAWVLSNPGLKRLTFTRAELRKMKRLS